jgi:hypothetical protein
MEALTFIHVCVDSSQAVIEYFHVCVYNSQVALDHKC